MCTKADTVCVAVDNTASAVGAFMAVFYCAATMIRDGITQSVCDVCVCVMSSDERLRLDFSLLDL